MALACENSAGKWKYVNSCLDFLGTAYVKRQARPEWTYARRSSVTPNLIIWCWLSFANMIVILNSIYFHKDISHYTIPHMRMSCLHRANYFHLKIQLWRTHVISAHASPLHGYTFQHSRNVMRGNNTKWHTFQLDMNSIFGPKNSWAECYGQIIVKIIHWN